jgi:hypothetical protein
VVSLPQIANLPQKYHKTMFLRFMSGFEPEDCPSLNEDNILSFGDDLSGGKPTPIHFLNCCPSRPLLIFLLLLSPT